MYCVCICTLLCFIYCVHNYIHHYIQLSSSNPNSTGQVGGGLFPHMIPSVQYIHITYLTYFMIRPGFQIATFNSHAPPRGPFPYIHTVPKYT